MYDFGLTDAQFWKLTPLKFRALARRHDEAARRADSHTARLCYAVMSAAGATKKSKEPFTIQDFMPDYGDGDDAPTSDMKPDQILAAMKAAFPPERSRRGRKKAREANG